MQHLKEAMPPGMSLYRSLMSEPCDIVHVSGCRPHTSYTRTKATTALRGSKDDETRERGREFQGAQRDRQKADFVGLYGVAGMWERVRRGGLYETIKAGREHCNPKGSFQRWGCRSAGEAQRTL